MGNRQKRQGTHAMSTNERQGNRQKKQATRHTSDQHLQVRMALKTHVATSPRSKTSSRTRVQRSSSPIVNNFKNGCLGCKRIDASAPRRKIYTSLLISGRCVSTKISTCRYGKSGPLYRIKLSSAFSSRAMVTQCNKLSLIVPSFPAIWHGAQHPQEENQLCPTSWAVDNVRRYTNHISKDVLPVFQVENYSQEPVPVRCVAPDLSSPLVAKAPSLYQFPQRRSPLPPNCKSQPWLTQITQMLLGRQKKQAHRSK